MASYITFAEGHIGLRDPPQLSMNSGGVRVLVILDPPRDQSMHTKSDEANAEV